jgi:alpha-tubulin suppressor-like RCC1 family protein
LGDGQSGQGHQNPTPSLVPGLSGASALRAGGDTTCAILGESLACWGDGTYGQIGDGTAANGHYQSSPYHIPDLHAVIDVSINSQNVCAVVQDGSAYCWGLNSSSEWLGFASSDCGPFSSTTGGASTLLPCETAPRQVPAVQGAAFISTGGEDVCVGLLDGTTECWGDNTFGQVGNGSSGATASVVAVAPVGSLPVVRRLALGSTHSCGLTKDSAVVWCWGDNSSGQLGIGTSSLDSLSTTPVQLGLASGVRDLDANGDATCAVTTEGGVSCWGDVSALLPLAVDSGAGNLTTPTKVSGVSDATTVRTGLAHACVLHNNSTVACWGLNDQGQLGNGAVGSGDYTLGPVAGVLQVTPLK